MTSPRLAARAVIVHQDRLLLVNAWPGGQSPLWCAPGGGVNRGTSLPENLRREVHEETGLTIAVGAPCLINEFHDPQGSFHQVEVFFRCTITEGQLSDNWQDPEGIVTTRRFFTEPQVRALPLKPSSLPDVAFGTGLSYDPLEPIVR
ncbi:NUDIX domain-containing protein [Tropicibacter naphthalenivorans]|uniref:NUDIX domain protein n=1 Tax=Tropicibacter naphthalenivorans TaxID=441103 RepID=A0A0P1GKV6_9RHOB|nr:NUDIX hydrolase [Tropicibacter naphthalenivorans]CUH74853.1 NUDIX domain protein [Tropicibacter naphthalenivorans]SMC48653.1 ADP-ribose pyrophosphatase YjhB, NUDIX family [Tropicibacter naphthalenivorans]